MPRVTCVGDQLVEVPAQLLQEQHRMIERTLMDLGVEAALADEIYQLLLRVHRGHRQLSARGRGCHRHHAAPHHREVSRRGQLGHGIRGRVTQPHAHRGAGGHGEPERECGGGPVAVKRAGGKGYSAGYGHVSLRLLG